MNKMRLVRVDGWRVGVAAVVAAAGLLATGQLSAQRSRVGGPADLVILNGRVYTSDGSGTFSEAVAIRGNQIAQVGRTADLERLRGPQTEVVDARGRAVVAGFNDSHVHFLNGGFSLEQVDLAGLTTLEDVQDKIRAFAAAHMDREWIRGRGWLYSPFPGGLPVKEQLDAVVADRPAVLSAYDGHSTWANTKALQMAGITKHSPNPLNGEIVKDAKTGEPTGLLKESAGRLVTRLLPAPTTEDRRAALRAAVAYAHRVGVTSVQNASGSPDEFTFYDEARRAGDLKIRVYSALSISPNFSEADADAFDEVWKRYPDDPIFKTGAVKIVSDGVIESKTASMLAPYEHSTTSGHLNHSPEELKRIITMMDRRGWQIFVHSIGDGAVRATLDAFEHASAVNPAPARGRRHRIEHVETIDAADIPRFGKLGVIASVQPMHAVLGDMNSERPSGPWPDNIGRNRASRGWNWKSIRDAGARLTFGSDWAVAPLEAGMGIWLVATRLTAPDMKSQRMWLAEAVDGYTQWPAYASFEETRKGRLAPGMLADVVVLSRDIFAQPPTSRDDVVVDTTIFDGKVVYRRDAASTSAGR